MKLSRCFAALVVISTPFCCEPEAVRALKKMIKQSGIQTAFYNHFHRWIAGLTISTKYAVVTFKLNARCTRHASPKSCRFCPENFKAHL